MFLLVSMYNNIVEFRQLNSNSSEILYACFMIEAQRNIFD